MHLRQLISYRLRVATVAASIAVCVAPVCAAESNLADLSLAELMNEPVTSVSKKETRLGDAPTAITVITAEDIRRLGITSIPEALRLVPGFDVARIDGSHWAISARGFNLQYANTLLVLVDGRSVYSPAFGGVYWDAQDLALEDLDRIEVIRGPGAVLWGANAVNGVVNVISRSAGDTQGLSVGAAVGTEDRPTVQARYGGSLGHVQYRTYAKYFDRNGLLDANGQSAPDDWHSARVGFRSDWTASENRLLTLQADYYSLRAEHVLESATLSPPFTTVDRTDEAAKGGNVIARWTQTLSPESQFSLQAYIDSYDRSAESRDTVDIQMEHRFAPAPRHDVVWGVGYRITREDLHLASTLISDPARDTSAMYTAFLQDEITLLPGRLKFTAGTKVERNEITGVELQPNARLLWTPAPDQSAWLSASRAVSTPSRFYTNSRFTVGAFQPPSSPVVEVALMPNADLPSQKLNAFELGYRIQVSEVLSADLATFYNKYKQLYGVVAGAPSFEMDPFPHVLAPLNWESSLVATSYGAELEANWRPTSSWRLTGTYSWLHLRVRPDPILGTGSPAHQWSLRSYTSVSARLEISALIAYVDRIESLKTVTQTAQIPSYVRFDAGLVMHPTDALQVGLWGQNLLDPSHPEISSQDSRTVSEVPRGVLLRVTRHF